MSDKPFPWRTLLFVSVAFNLLIVGAFAGAYGAGVRLQRDAPEASIARMPGARAFMAALPEDTRAKVRRSLADSLVESRASRRTAAQARREAFDAVAVEPYDSERVRAAFARAREADQAAIGVFQDNVAQAFAALTPEERREALAALRRTTPGRRNGLAPAGEDANDTATPAREQLEDRRETVREKLRERRRERREGMEQRRQQR